VRQVVKARPRAYFLCVGAVEPQMQKALWEMAAADGVAERIRFTGERNDVQRLMAEMEVITLPSRYEACSMSIIEAMAMGKPVVATRAGGNPELVRHQETGLLIERNPEALADALITLLADADRRRQMGEAGRHLARTRFSASIMVSHIEALYREMLAGA
jgi:glycosyltransferase involved in cell wall biosynthesis